MTSMYETIMELPLFKGLGAEQLSLMLEKTSVEFLNFDPGTIIHEESKNVKVIDFILKGKVGRTFKMSNPSIQMEEIIGEGCVLGASHLFGLHTRYWANTEAKEKTSLMRITKHDYRNILLSDEIYLMNFMNYLSAAAQRPGKLALSTPSNSISSFLQLIIVSLVSPMAESISFNATDEDMARFCGVKISEWTEWKEAVVESGSIFSEKNKIIISKQ